MRRSIIFAAALVLLTACGAGSAIPEESALPPAGKPFQQILIEDEAEPYPAAVFTLSKTPDLASRLSSDIEIHAFEADREKDHIDAGLVRQARDGIVLTAGAVSSEYSAADIVMSRAVQHYKKTAVDRSDCSAIQQAYLFGRDGMAGACITRFRTDQKEGYSEYLAGIAFTNGSVTAAEDITCAAGPSSEEGKRAEASLRSILAAYGLDLGRAMWTELETGAGTSSFSLESIRSLERSDTDVIFGPLQTFADAFVYSHGDIIRSVHPSGVTITYRLRKNGGMSAKDFLLKDMEYARGILPRDFESSDIKKKKDGTLICSFSYTDKNGEKVRGTYAVRKLKFRNMCFVATVTEDSLFGYSEDRSRTYEGALREMGLLGEAESEK